MRFTKIIGCIGALALISTVAPITSAQAAPETPANPNTAIAIMQASAALQSNDCPGAMAPLTQLWNDATLAASDPELAGQFRFQRIGCTAQISGLKAALDLSGENIRHEPVTADAYDMHIFLLLMDKQNDAATLSLDAALTRFKGHTEGLSDSSVLGVLITEQTEHPATAATLLDHIEESRWQAHAVVMQGLLNYLRLQGLRAAVASANQPLADLYRSDIETDVTTYVLSQSDATLSQAAVAPKPVGPIIQKQIDDLKAYVGSNPDDLMALTYLMLLERMAGQNELALTQLNGIIALIDKYGVEKFKGAESYGELLRDRAELLADLGKEPDAIAAYEAAAAKLTGSDQSDLYLSYMNFLIDSGHDMQGLKLTTRMDTAAMTDGQKANLVAYAACAYGYTGDTVHYEAALAVLNAESPMRVKSALCAGRTEDAAKFLIAALNAPEMRESMLSHMQEGLPVITFSPRDQILANAYAGLKKRPDVLGATKAAGIIVRKWPLRF